jgi:hypothetical protein
MGATKELIRWRGSFEGHRDDLDHWLLIAQIASRRFEPHATVLPRPVKCMRYRVGAVAVVNLEPEAEGAMPLVAERNARCPFVKIGQILGEEQCYLLRGHDGLHCSTEWREWS